MKGRKEEKGEGVAQKSFHGVENCFLKPGDNVFQ